MDDRLGLKLCLNLLRDWLPVGQRTGVPEAFAKTDQHQRSARQAVVVFIADGYESPPIRMGMAKGTGARITEPTAGN
jgi:hypothetical protein